MDEKTPNGNKDFIKYAVCAQPEGQRLPLPKITHFLK